MESVVENHLVLDRILANLPFPDLCAARLVCRTWSYACLPYLQSTLRLDPTILLLSDPENLRSRCQFLGNIGQVRLFLSNHSFPSPYHMHPYPLLEIEEYREKFRNSNPTKPIPLFFKELLPLIGNAVNVLRLETNLETEEDLDRLLNLFRFLPNLRKLCFALIKISEPVLKKSVCALKQTRLFPKLTHLYPIFNFPVHLGQEEKDEWKPEFLSLISSIGWNVEDIDLEGYTPIWDRSAVWLQQNDLRDVVQGFKRLKSIAKIYGEIGTASFLKVKRPIGRLYVLFGSGLGISGLLATLSNFSETLNLIDIMWQVDLNERIGERGSLPRLPALRVFSVSVFAMNQWKDHEYSPPLDNLREKGFRDTFTPVMMDPFMIKEELLQRCKNLPQLESLYLLFPHLRGEEMWDYFFPTAQERINPEVSSCPVRKLVISKIKDNEKKEWINFQDRRVKTLFPKLERLRYFKLVDAVLGEDEDSVFLVPEEVYFAEEKIEWESKHRGVWLKYREHHVNRDIPVLVQFALRNSTFHNAFIQYDGDYMFA